MPVRFVSPSALRLKPDGASVRADNLRLLVDADAAQLVGKIVSIKEARVDDLVGCVGRVQCFTPDGNKVAVTLLASRCPPMVLWMHPEWTNGIAIKPEWLEVVEEDDDDDDLASAPLRHRLSPPFTIMRKGHRLPLRALTNTDGFGRIGLFAVYSAHEGPGPLRWWATETWGLEEGDDPLDLARGIGTYIHCHLTEPMHDPADRREAGVTEMAFKPEGVFDEIEAMVRAGIIPKETVLREKFTRSRAMLYDVPGMSGWEEIEWVDDASIKI